MPQRTIGEARQQLDALSELMSPKTLDPYRAEFDAAQMAALDMATRYMDRTVDDAEALSSRIEDQLREVHDGYAVLIREGDAGRIAGREFSERYTKLRYQQRSAERRLAEVARTADRLEGIETDPEAWADAFYSRFPLVRPEFSF
jgi:hypothetical protein